jgi:hypothetical protein
MAKEEKDLKLTLKLTDEGVVELTEQGLPIWVDQDDKEVVFDVAKLYNDKRAANAESASRRKRIDELDKQLTELHEKYQGLDVEEAKKALETLQNIDQQKLMDTEGVESVKRQMKEAFNAELTKEREKWEKDLKEKSETLEMKGGQIRNLLVKNAFVSSEFLREKTLLTPEIAYAYFGNHFVIQEVDGQPTAIGRLNGENILSKRNPGELAEPEEAIEIIIDKYPNKERILKGNVQAGSGVFNPEQRASEQSEALVDAFYPTMKQRK